MLTAITSTGGIVPCFAECDWPTEFPFCCKFQSYIVCGDNIRHRIFVIAGSGLPNCFEGDPLFHSQQSFGNSLNSIQIDWYIHDELSIWAIYAQHVPFLSNRESQKTYLGFLAIFLCVKIHQTLWRTPKGKSVHVCGIRKVWHHEIQLKVTDMHHQSYWSYCWTWMVKPLTVSNRKIRVFLNYVCSESSHLHLLGFA